MCEWNICLYVPFIEENAKCMVHVSNLLELIILEIEDHRGVSNFKGGALFCHQVVALGGGIGSVKYDFCSQRCSSHWYQGFIRDKRSTWDEDDLFLRFFLGELFGYLKLKITLFTLQASNGLSTKHVISRSKLNPNWRKTIRWFLKKESDIVTWSIFLQGHCEGNHWSIIYINILSCRSKKNHSAREVVWCLAL